MGAICNLYIKEDVLETLLKTIRGKKEKGVSLTISIDDKTNDYGQNISSFVSQTKEQRDAKVKKYYVGNGALVWISDDGVSVATKVDKTEKQGRPNLPHEIENEEPPF